MQRSRANWRQQYNAPEVPVCIESSSIYPISYAALVCRTQGCAFVLTCDSRLTAHRGWCANEQATDGPVQFRPYQGMDKWDYYMQNRDAKLLREGLGAKAAKAGWWDFPKKEAV